MRSQANVGCESPSGDSSPDPYEYLPSECRLFRLELFEKLKVFDELFDELFDEESSAPRVSPPSHSSAATDATCAAVTDRFRKSANSVGVGYR